MLTKCDTPWKQELHAVVSECIADGRSPAETTDILNNFVEMWLLKSMAAFVMIDMDEDERVTVAAKAAHYVAQVEG
jgi:hypothetical protein